MTYSILQWMLFFYIYCFVGWIWETIYVSVRLGHWVNRGFMHGPFLPIYGAGFTGMVMLTSAIRGMYVVEFIVGMIGATIMEYYTGMIMEKLFKVRYWDYSNCKFNVKGYICLKASVCWGFFAILGPEVIHPFFENLVLKISQTPLEIIVLILTAYVAADFSESFKEALDFKEVLANITASNEEIARIEKGVQAISEFVNGDLKEKSEAGLKKINTTITDGMHMYERTTEQLSELKNKLSDTLEKVKQLPGEIKLPDSETFTNLKEQVEEYRHKISSEEKARAFLKERRSVKKSYRIIKRNPEVFSKEYQGALEELKKEISNRFK